MIRSMSSGAAFLAAVLLAGDCAAQTTAPAAGDARVSTAPAPTAPAAPASSLIIDQQRADRAPVTPSTAAPQLPTASVEVAAPARVATISAVRLEGSSIAAEVCGATEPYVGRPLDLPTLQALANAVATAYAASDIAIFSVQAPPQDFAGGVVRLQITEGMIAQVAITGDIKSGDLTLVKAYGAKLAGQKPLRRKTFERYISLIRDIPGLAVEPSLKSTDMPGVSMLVLNIKQTRFRREISFGDRGTPRLGRVQAQGSVTVNGLLRQGDQTQLSAAAPFEVKRFQYVSLAHSTPVGSEGLRVGGSMGFLRTRPKDSPIRGEAVTAGVNLTYPLVRGFKRNLYVTGALDGLNSDNAAYGQLLSQDHTRAARAGLSFSDSQARRFTNLGVTGSAGLDILGAQTFSGITDADFRKVNLTFVHNQMLGAEWIARLRGTAQISHGLLPAGEQLALGGETFGRAFTSAYVIGDKGAAASAELGWMSKSLWPKPLTGSELYGFADWGTATTRGRFFGLIPRARYDLGSAGAGARFNWRGKTIVNIEGAKAIENPYTRKSWRLSFGWQSVF